MRILMLTDYYPPHLGGGVEQVVYQLASRLAARNHAVRVLALSARLTGRDGNGAGPNLTVRRVPASDLSDLLGVQASWSWSLLPALRSESRSFKPDVVHAHNLFFRTTEAATVPGFLNGAPLVTTMHLGDSARLGMPLRTVLSAYEQTIGRWVVRHSSAIICVSNAVADHARGLGATARTLNVIPNGVDTEKFSPIGVAEPSRTVLFVGRLVPNKGPDVLVRAAPQILSSFPDARFVVAGDGPMLAEVQRTAMRAGVVRSFQFLGLTTEVPALMREATLLVRPSTLEGMPLAVLEAMSSGLPVVASDVGGTRELVRDGVNGFLVRPGDAAELAAGVNRVLANPSLSRAMGLEGRKRAEQFSWDHAVESTEAVYSRVVAGP